MKNMRIATKIKIAGFILSLIIVGIISTIIIMNDKSKKDSLIINIAGKERMLTQMMTKEVFFLRHRNGYDFRALNSAMDLFEYNLGNLMHGNADSGIYKPQNRAIADKLEQVANYWKPFRGSIEKVKENILLAKDDQEILPRKIEALLSISDTIVKEMLEKKLDGIYIDLSGRQRMLTQRMALYLERYLRTDNKEGYFLYLNARRLYDETLTMFVNDKQIESYKDLHNSVKRLKTTWDEFNEYADRVLETEKSINDLIRYINQENIKILNAMDEAVWLYTVHSEDKNQLFLNTLYFICILAMSVIVYTFILLRDMANNIERFVNRAKTLADAKSPVEIANMPLYEEGEEMELKEASSYIQTFASKVNIAMHDSEIAVKRAENSIRELQILAETMEDTLKDIGVDDETKDRLSKNANVTEDIAIESAENLLNISKMLKKLRTNLDDIQEVIKSDK